MKTRRRGHGRGGGEGDGIPVPAPRKGLGQHFLTDPGILQRIVTGAGVVAGERVLEIGPGPGGLTRALLAAGARVLAIEADPRMVQHLEGTGPGLEVITGDALRVDYLALSAERGGPFRLVANLPYNISGPLLALLLRQRDAFVSLTVMLQKEVADRLLAPPGGRTRGRLGVLAQCFCEVRSVMKVAPGSFRPPPKVESRVVRLDVRPEPPAPLRDEAVLWDLTRTGFGQKRKMLRNSLRGVTEAVAPLLAAAGLEGAERPEELDVVQWIGLANALVELR